MPVQVVLAQVEHRGGGGLEAASTPSSWKLDSSSTQTSGQFSRRRVELRGQRVEQRRADVAGDGHAPAGALDQQRRHRGRGGLAVGAGDRQQLRRVAALASDRPARARTDRARPAPAVPRSARRGQQRRDAFIVRRQARALQHQLQVGQQRRVECAAQPASRCRRARQRAALRRASPRPAHARRGAAHQRAIARPESPRPSTSTGVSFSQCILFTAASGSPARPGTAAW